MRPTDLFFASALAIASVVALGCNREAGQKNGSKAGDANTASLTENDRELILTAANDGLLEVEAGRLAENRAKAEPVRQFARMMVEHHAKANAELAKLAERKEIAVPLALDEDAQAMLEDLREEIGRSFDEEYLDLMIEEHQRVIRQFEREANNEEFDADVRTWASETLPTLRSHLVEAKRTEDSLGDIPIAEGSARTPPPDAHASREPAPAPGTPRRESP